MSHIDDLIQRLCPNGVEFKSLGEVATYVRGVTYSKGQEALGGPIRVLRSNNITLASNTLNFDDVKHVSGDVRPRADQRLLAGDLLVSAASGSKAHVGKVAYIEADLDYHFGGFMGVIRSVTNSLDARFLFHVMASQRFADYLTTALSTTTINNLNSGIVKSFTVPVPPLEVQREIVRVLDLFQSLEAELEARRRQYAHYRDKLITGSVADPGEWIALGQLGDVFRGRRFVKDDYVTDGLAAIHYGQIYTHYGTRANDVLTRVRAELKPVLRFARTGDIVIAEVGETVEDVAKAVAWLGEEEVAVHDGCFVLRHKQNPTYLAYCMQIAAFHAEKAQFVARAKVKRLSFDGVKQLRVPVPPLEDQERIVTNLDKFDALVNDLSSGLPAELAARRKQYEYYRNKLLTFEEAA